MANNRMFILNKATNEAFFVAKSFGQGWEVRCTLKALKAFLKEEDWESNICGGPSNFCIVTEGELPKDVERRKMP